MHDAVFERLISQRERATRRVKHSDFTNDQLNKIRELYRNRQYLSVSEMAILLGVCDQTVYKLIAEGKVVAIKLVSEKGSYSINLPETQKNFDYKL